MNLFKPFIRSQTGGMSAGLIALGAAVMAIGAASLADTGSPTVEERFEAQLEQLQAKE